MDSQRKIDRKNRKLKKAQAFLSLVKSDQELAQMEQKETVKRLQEVKVDQDQDETDTKLGQKFPNDEGLSEEKQKLSPEAFNEMKKILRERNKMALQRPKLFLTPDDILPFKVKPVNDEGEIVMPPLYTIDLQHLLLYALQGNICSFKPRWCKLLRVAKVSSVVMIFLDGVGYSDFTDDKESFSFIAKTFNLHVEMVCPEQYGSSVDREINSVPLSVSQIKKTNVRVHDDIRKKVAAKIKPGKKGSTVNSTSVISSSVSSAEDKFSRVCLLLSSDQMKMEGYPMPVKTENNQYSDFVFTKDHYTEVTSDSPLFALDCEMCLTSIRKNELTRVSVVAENGETVYDSLVKPWNRIVNYNTKYSGITKQMLDPIDVRLENVRKDLKKLLPPDAILCGQSLNFDLIALKIFHPYVIDTSVIFNMSGKKGVKAGLRRLTGFFLNRTIQDSEDGHCSVEDAKATLDLVKLKLQRGLEFGDATTSGIYFPNIETYFLGSEGGSKATIENVEHGKEGTSKLLESPDKSSPDSLKRPHQGDSDHLDTKKLKTSHEKNSLSGASENNSWRSSTEQVAIFNQNNSVHVFQSFFKLIDEAGRTGCMIGRESLTSKYEKEPIEKCVVSSDKEACKSAKEAVLSKEFTWVNFHKYRDAVIDPESSKEYLESIKKKMDRRVEKVVNKAKEKSLVVVMMTGLQTGGSVINAGTFVCIT